MKELKISVGYLVIAAFEIALHWFLSTQNKLAQSLLSLYLYRFPNNGKGIFALLDLFFPSIVLGLLIGWFGWDWSLRKLSCLTALATIGIITLTPTYVFILGKDRVWWWPETSADLIVKLIIAVIETLVMVGVFAYWGRSSWIHFHGKASGV
jgi:hypothetical protein